MSILINDPKVNEKVDYLFVGQGTEEAKGFLQRCVALYEGINKTPYQTRILCWRTC